MAPDLDPLTRALATLERGLARWRAAPADEELRDACIQRFEFTFELCWKTLKRRLEADLPNPGEVDLMNYRTLMRVAAERGLVGDVKAWWVYRDKRNLASHTYNAAVAIDVAASLAALHEMLKPCWRRSGARELAMLEIDPFDLRLARELVRRHIAGRDVRVFGSRVCGWPGSRGVKPYSDLDLVVMGADPLADFALVGLRADLEDSALPFRVDVVRHVDLPVRLQALVERSAEPLFGS